MMEPDDDDDNLSYTSDGDLLFAIDDDDDDDLVTKRHHAKQQRVGGAAVCGGMTGALLAVPLVAIDVTVLAVAAPVAVVVAAGGAAFVAANSTGSPKEMMQAGGDAIARAGEGFLRRSSSQQRRIPEEGELKSDGCDLIMTAAEEEKVEEEIVDGHQRFNNWVTSVFQRDFHEGAPELLRKQDESKEEEEKENKPLNVGLLTGGLLWLGPPRKPTDEQLESTKAQELEQLGRKGEQNRDTNEHETGKQPPVKVKGPFGWYVQHRSNKTELSAPQAASMKVTDPTAKELPQCKEASETPEVPAKRNWMSPLLGRRVESVERDDTDSCDMDRHDDSDCDSDDDSQYDSDESESEEVVFDFEEYGICSGSLFADGIVEQAHAIV